MQRVNPFSIKWLCNNIQWYSTTDASCCGCRGFNYKKKWKYEIFS